MDFCFLSIDEENVVKLYVDWLIDKKQKSIVNWLLFLNHFSRILKWKH